jgi:fructosamine-3-kinase
MALTVPVKKILTATGIRLVDPQPVSGGSINRCWRARDAEGRVFFVKLNRLSAADMFAAEMDGLRELRCVSAVRVPEPVACGVANGEAWLLLEYLDLQPGCAVAAAALGRALARQHRHTAERFGWRRDNTIGSTPQRNGWLSDWTGFWRERRLGFQLALAREHGYGRALGDRGARVVEALPKFLCGYEPVPSLLHGDLWGGNWAMTAEGEPVIYDPAVYYGDREADLAMTELFGGFPREFHVAYEQAWPLDAGYRVRRDIYNLYHVLNHLNLFGGGYLRQAVSLMDRLLAEL